MIRPEEAKDPTIAKDKGGRHGVEVNIEGCNSLAVILYEKQVFNVRQ